MTPESEWIQKCVIHQKALDQNADCAKSFHFEVKKKWTNKKLSTYLANYHKMQSSKEMEGMTEEEINKHWQAKKLF